jgi:thiol-disulfide isomerase/thioredoxin
MKKLFYIIILSLFTCCGKNPSKDFIFTFEGYPAGDTAFLQFGPDYRSPKYPLIISQEEVHYVNDSIGNTLLAKIYVKGNYGSPFVLERGKVHKVKNGKVTGSVDNDNFESVCDSVWTGAVFTKILEAQRLRDSAKTDEERKMYHEQYLQRHFFREKMVRDFLNRDTLGVGLYIAYILKTTSSPSEMKLWLDNHKRFEGDEYYKKLMRIYISQSKAQVGMKLEDFEAVDLHGRRFTLYRFLQDFKGKAVIIDFWASWCGACRAKAPRLKESYKKYRKEGLEIIGVSCDDTEAKWIKAVEKDGTGIWINVIDKANTTGKKYGITGIPKTFVIDKDGIIHYSGVGDLADETETVVKLLKSKNSTK